MLGRYLFEVIVMALRTELAGFKVRNPRLRDVGLRRAGESFQHGMVARIAARLTADQAQREAFVAAQRTAGTALMLIKRSIVEEAFAATQTRLVSARRSARRVVRSAYQDGMQAGDKVNLTRPLPDRVLPLATPGLLAAAVFGFIMSFDEFSVSFFVAGPGVNTLPIELFNYTEINIDPTVSAVSTVLIALSVIAFVVIERTVGLAKMLG